MKYKIIKPFSMFYKISGDISLPERGIYFETFATLDDLDKRTRELMLMESHGDNINTKILFMYPDAETLKSLY